MMKIRQTVFQSQRLYIKLFKNQVQQPKQKKQELRSINPQKNIKYSFEGIEQYKDLAKKEEFIGELSKNSIQKRLAKKGAKQYKEDVFKKTKEKLQGESKEEKKEEKVDELWDGNMMNYCRKYDRIYSKELQWKQKDQNEEEEINYKNDYLFQKRIQEGKIRELIEKMQLKRKEYEQKVEKLEYDRTVVFEGESEMIEELLEMVKSVNVEYLGQLVMEIGTLAQMKTNHSNIYQVIEQRLFRYMHTFSIDQLIQIKYGLSCLSPKYGSNYLHKAIDDLIVDHLSNHPLTLLQLLHLYHSYRNNINNRFHTLFLNQLIQLQPQAQSLIKSDPDIIANIIYTYCNCRIRNGNRKKFREDNEDINEFNKVLKCYSQQLQSSISSMSIKGLIRTLSGINLSKTDQLGIYSMIELELMQRIGINNLSVIELGLVVKYMGSGQNRQPFGSGQFYSLIGKELRERWGQLSDMTRARGVYVLISCEKFTEREELVKTLLESIIDRIEMMQHGELHFLIYALMFQRETNNQLWIRVVRRVAQLKTVVPQVYFNSFKLMQLYLTALFPQWDLHPYSLSLLPAERLYTTSHLASFYLNDSQFLHFSQLLHFQLNISTQNCIHFQNTFIIDYLVRTNRIAILLLRDIHKFTDSSIRPILLLHQFILQHNHYVVQFCDFTYYMSLSQQERKDVFMKQFNQLCESQKEVLKKVEDKEWEDFYENLYQRTKHVEMIGEEDYFSHLKKLQDMEAGKYVELDQEEPIAEEDSK